ncbi:MAG: hypothetical protein JST22_00705 [Bacteroidetes bacterium]|nr:hypothetical protein [Bacteroidota bacterium]
MSLRAAWWMKVARSVEGIYRPVIIAKEEAACRAGPLAQADSQHPAAGP